MYAKRNSKFGRKYGKKMRELAKIYNVSAATIGRWEKSGYDIFYKGNNFKKTHCFRGDKRLHWCWSNMKNRCGNPKDKKYKYYGGKGIKVEMTKEELAILWEKYNANIMMSPSVDRIDTNKNYSITNCKILELQKNRENRWKK